MIQSCLRFIPLIAFALLGACTEDVAPAEQRGSALGTLEISDKPDGPSESLQNRTFVPAIDKGPVRGCSAKAKCPNGASISCDVEGNGTCSGTDGVGVQCITYNNNGDPVESGGVCGGK
jgi:hypothetical protein